MSMTSTQLRTVLTSFSPVSNATALGVSSNASTSTSTITVPSVRISPTTAPPVLTIAPQQTQPSAQQMANGNGSSTAPITAILVTNPASTIQSIPFQQTTTYTGNYIQSFAPQPQQQRFFAMLNGKPILATFGIPNNALNNAPLFAIAAPTQTMMRPLSTPLQTVPTALSTQRRNALPLLPPMPQFVHSNSASSASATTTSSATMTAPTVSVPNQQQPLSVIKGKPNGYKWHCKNDPTIASKLTAQLCLKLDTNGVEKWICPHHSCGKTFAKQSALEAHFRKHTRFAFVCDICDARFARNANLREHRRVHTGERPFVCPVKGCGKAFKQQHCLKDHSLSHSGERPFVCQRCGKKFSLRHNLITHQRLYCSSVSQKYSKDSNEQQ